MRLSSVLSAPAERVWARVTTIEGITDELRPWLQMTFPGGLRGRALPEAPTGRPLGRAWLLLGGVLPVEYDDLALESVGELSFVERSKLGSAREWRHERTVVPQGSSSLLTDSLTLVPRRFVPPAAARLVVARLFAHRHARLRRHFGGTR